MIEVTGQGWKADTGVSQRVIRERLCVCLCVLSYSIWALRAALKQTQPVLRMQVDQECATGRYSGWDRAGLISGFRLGIKYSSWVLQALVENGLYCFVRTKAGLEQRGSSVYCQITCYLVCVYINALLFLFTHYTACFSVSLLHTHTHAHIRMHTSTTHKHILRLFQTV